MFIIAHSAFAFHIRDHGQAPRVFSYTMLPDFESRCTSPLCNLLKLSSDRYGINLKKENFRVNFIVFQIFLHSFGNLSLEVFFINSFNMISTFSI